MKLKSILRKGIVLTGIMVFGSLSAQTKITIDHKTQRFIGETSELNRDTYFNIHGKFKQSDADFSKFIYEYNIRSDYKGSRGLWNPMGRLKNGKIPHVKKIHSGVREVQGHVDSGRAGYVFYKKDVDYSVEDVTEFSYKAAQFAVDFYRYQEDNVPQFFEPFNEPMVHANDFYPKKNNKKYDKEKIDKIITKMCEFHKILGQRVHAAPELKNMNVIGYASAYPEFEGKDFSVWNTRYKKFIDIAGADMDMFSVHLYDGSGNVNNKGGRRSGSNSEAILDLIEGYSYAKLGKVKPIAITEYGRLVQDQPGFPNVPNFEPIENSQAVRSQIHMVMNFMERGDDIALTIPFTTGKSKPTFRFSKASLWAQNKSGKWEFTPRKYFFEIWKDVKGDRVAISSSNIDVQTQAFVDGKELFVVLNNLNDDTQEVDLALLDSKNLKKVEVKRLKIFKDKTPDLNVKETKSAPQKLKLAYGETVVLKYQFKKKIEFENTIRSKKYYAEKCVTPIVASKEIGFSFKNVKVAKGKATLRLGVGRKNGASLNPIVLVNGKKVTITTDVIRGYDQHNRKQFFGTLEIPVNIEDLNNGENKVSVKFEDQGGHISSAILQVQKLD
ncbi:hypothetical protein [Flavicella sp.]|uniref:hypothetical protein n=1 Tax=Flavicella sp. TaxID=2957742 RepID=UPI002614EA68|nr:hypothetical protein [Flavicella sp.]MDG1804571.1 hypothetical protein [Flavicella sp.]MDG2281125.1 hypothetical protein [Flavicella sp.]